METHIYYTCMQRTFHFEYSFVAIQFSLTYVNLRNNVRYII